MHAWSQMHTAPKSEDKRFKEKQISDRQNEPLIYRLTHSAAVTHFIGVKCAE